MKGRNLTGRFLSRCQFSLAAIENNPPKQRTLSSSNYPRKMVWIQCVIRCDRL